MNRAVFFDRDNTLIKDVDYKDGTTNFSPRRVEDVEFLPDVIDALQSLAQTDFKIVIVTNQSGISRGLYDIHTLRQIHKKILDTLATVQVYVDGVFYCPHKDEDRCDCRKPSPKMLNLASWVFDIDLEKSFMVGDSSIDVQAGKNAGCKTVYIGKLGETGSIIPDYVAPNMTQAIQFILSSTKLQPSPI